MLRQRDICGQQDRHGYTTLLLSVKVKKLSAMAREDFLLQSGSHKSSADFGSLMLNAGHSSDIDIDVGNAPTAHAVRKFGQ